MTGALVGLVACAPTIEKVPPRDGAKRTAKEPPVVASVSLEGTEAMMLWDDPSARGRRGGLMTAAVWGEGQPVRVLARDAARNVRSEGRSLHLVEVDLCPDEPPGTVVVPLVERVDEVRLRATTSPAACGRPPILAGCDVRTATHLALTMGRAAGYEDLPRTDRGFLATFQEAVRQQQALVLPRGFRAEQEPMALRFVEPLYRCAADGHPPHAKLVVRSLTCVDGNGERRVPRRLVVRVADDETRHTLTVLEPREVRPCTQPPVGPLPELPPPTALRPSALELPTCGDLPSGDWRPMTPVSDPAALPEREVYPGQIRTALLVGDAVVVPHPADRRGESVLLNPGTSGCIDDRGRARIHWLAGTVTTYDDPDCPAKRGLYGDVPAYRVPPDRPVLGLARIEMKHEATCKPPPRPERPCDHPWCRGCGQPGACDGDLERPRPGGRFER